MKRTTNVNFMNVNSSTFSSIIQIGDAKIADPYIRALAVQREGILFYTDRHPFSEFNLFSRPFVIMTNEIPLEQMHINHEKDIFVNGIDVVGVTGSSIVQLGSLDEIDAKARIKHIRIIKED